MTDSATAANRTRSQSTLDHFLSLDLTASPLKQARSALKQPLPPPLPLPPPPSDAHPSTFPQDGLLKRPSSPAKDAALLLDRHLKRPRHEHLFPLLVPPLPSITPNDNLSSPAPSARATSVPLLDLNNVHPPSSPRRKLRIASVPPDLHPSTRSRPTPPPRSPIFSLSPLPRKPNPTSTLSPMSPLTPLPDDSAPLHHTLAVATTPIPKPILPPSLVSSLEPSTFTVPTTVPQPPPLKSPHRESMLPRPTSVKSRMKPRAQHTATLPKKPKHPAVRKPNLPLPPSTRISRTTRSQKPQAQPNPPVAGASTATRRDGAHSEPEEDALAHHEPQSEHVFKPQAEIPPRNPERASHPDSGLDHERQEQERQSEAFAELHPQPEQQDPPSPPPSDSARPSHPRPVPLRSSHSQPALDLNSSLLNLNEALDRLNAPPPSRPNTSMGFHRSFSADGEEVSFGSKSAAGTDAANGAKGKGKVAEKQKERPRPGTSMSTRVISTAKGKDKAKVPATATASRAQGTPAAAGQKKLTQTTLMLPPPVPATGAKTRLRSVTQATNAAAATTATKRVSLFPPPSATGVGRGRPLAKPVFGVGFLGAGGRGRGGSAALKGRAGGSRVTQKVSKASSLPMVVGSPVKGGATREDGLDTDAVGGEVMAYEPKVLMGVEEMAMTTKDKIGTWLKNASEDVLRDLGRASDEDPDHPDDIESLAGPSNPNPSTDTNGEPGLSGPSTELGGSADTEKEKEERIKEREARRNASRRASMASHLLTQSLSALPDTPSPALGAGAVKDAKGKGRAVSSSYPPGASGSGARVDVEGEDEGEIKRRTAAAPPAPRAHNTRLATGALSTPPNAYKERSLRSSASAGSGLGNDGGSADGKGKGKEKEQESPCALAVLRECRIFVDVKTDEGDDAGGLFVDMLRGMGAKIATRVGSRCTHVVFKNGLMSTLTRYRLLSGPRPFVVGIAWVVECAEQRTKVDESRFLVNLDTANVAGVNKRRKSMLPKHYSPIANKIAASPASSDSSRTGTALNTSIGSGSRPAVGRSADQSMDDSRSMVANDDVDSSMQMLPLVAPAVVDDEESLPPLEKARRRRSMLPIRTG